MKLRHISPHGLGILLGLALSVAVLGCDGGGSSGTGGGGTGGEGTGAGGGGGMGGTGGEGTGGTAGEGMGGDGGTGGTGGGAASFSFFVSSTGSPTGNLGGLAGADKRCQDLATAVGAGAKTWRAYLSIENGANGQPEHAKDRIGKGPWYNAKLELVAANLEELHARPGDHLIFLDENGEMVPGQWEGSPDPNEHDIFTGSNLDGTVVPGKTCADWTSEDAALFGWIGHSDGLGPNMSSEPMYRPWQSVHENGGCHDTAPKGGAGRVYCFAID